MDCSLPRPILNIWIRRCFVLKQAQSFVLKRAQSIGASRALAMGKRSGKKEKKEKKDKKRKQRKQEIQQPLMFPMMPQSTLAAPQSKSSSDSSTSSSKTPDSDDEVILHKGGTCLSKLPKKRLCAMMTYLNKDITKVTAAEASWETLLRAAWCLTRSKPNTPLAVFRAKIWRQL